MRLPVIFLVTIGWMLYVQAQQATTPGHSPKPHEPSEGERYSFYYDYQSHKLLLTNNKICYIYHLHESEIAGVHTDAGLTKIEYKVFGLVSDAQLLDQAQPNHLPSSVVRHCGRNVTTFYQFLV